MSILGDALTKSGSVLSHPTLNRPLSYDEYNDVCNFLVNSGLHNGYKQDLSSNSESYVPDFNLTTLAKILDEINEMEM